MDRHRAKSLTSADRLRAKDVRYLFKQFQLPLKQDKCPSPSENLSTSIYLWARDCTGVDLRERTNFETAAQDPQQPSSALNVDPPSFRTSGFDCTQPTSLYP